MKINKNIKELSEDLAITSFNKVEHYFPIDRFFIESYGYLEKIKRVNSLQFLYYNLEKVNETYSIQLLLCLPELWEDIIYEDILKLIENFTNSFSFYAIIKFTYKYLEIDLLEEVLNNPRVHKKFKIDCIDYFIKTIATFYLDEDDYQVFDENLLGIHINDWNYIKQKLLIDQRINSALTFNDLYIKLKSFENK